MQHVFRSPTAVTAYCGEVQRPDEEARTEGLPPADADVCPDCVATWERLSGWTLDAARAYEARMAVTS